MIERTTTQHIKTILRDDRGWNLVDLGCSRGAWDEAQTAVDLDAQWGRWYQY